MASTKFESVDHYVASLPPLAQEVIQEIRRTVKLVAPQAEEGISYNMPTYKLHGRPLIHFAAWKEHIGFYPMPPEGTDVYHDLLPYLDSKATIRFPFKKPIPFDLVERLILYRAASIKPKK